MSHVNKVAGDPVDLKWTFAIDNAHEMVLLQCGFQNSSGKLQPLITQGPQDSIPRVLTNAQIPVKYRDRIFVTSDGTMRVIMLRNDDTGYYFCNLMVYHKEQFRIEIVRSPDTYLSVAGKFTKLI